MLTSSFTLIYAFIQPPPNAVLQAPYSQDGWQREILGESMEGATHTQPDERPRLAKWIIKN